jgi:hypothetical protein
VANPQLFADVLSFDQLAATAQPIQALGPAALGPSNVHALFIACVHRVAHHRDEKLLIWIYDIHVVASRLSPQEWDDFLRLAAAARVLGICRRGLELAVGEFRTPVPTRIWQDARWTPPAAEPSEAFLSRNRAQLATFVSDIRALPSWRARLRLVKEHLCPSPRYMRDVYAPASRAPLPMLYVHRAVRGAWRWLARD